jgi:4a-hydroxytetrahydrobiopterin dehydratase
MTNLADRELTPPKGKDTPLLTGTELETFLERLNNDWQVVEGHQLEKTYRFNNFQEALDFTNEVGALAESVDHHPEICLTWGKAKITIWTHSIGGLSEADFVFAARADRFVNTA